MKTCFFVLLLLLDFFANAQSTGGNDYQLLPENLTYFTAARNGKYVSLQWQTQNEMATKGFSVERKTGDKWETIVFVTTRATGGNSSARTSYDFNDANTFKGITQYRVTEETDNSKLRPSEIRAVKGENQNNNLTIYPNPSTDGNVNLVFDNGNRKDIAVHDITGRLVKQYNSVAKTNIAIEDLRPGLYTVRIVDNTTNESYAGKIIVNAR